MSRTAAFAIAASILAAAGAAASLLSGAPARAALLAPTNTAVVARGKQVYIGYCAACHGAALEGQPKWRERGPDGRLPAPPHDESGHTWHHPDAVLFRLTKFGPAALVGDGYASNMPGFGDVLSDPDIIAVLSYIKSTWPAQVLEHHDRINANASGQ